MSDYPFEFIDLFMRLKKPRPTGTPGRWKCLCPAHDDQKPSLSVKYDGSKHAVLVKCHALRGCTFEAICQAMGLEPKDFFGRTSLAAALVLRKGGVT